MDVRNRNYGYCAPGMWYHPDRGECSMKTSDYFVLRATPDGIRTVILGKLSEGSVTIVESPDMFQAEASTFLEKECTERVLANAAHASATGGGLLDYKEAEVFALSYPYEKYLAEFGTFDDIPWGVHYGVEYIRPDLISLNLDGNYPENSGKRRYMGFCGVNFGNYDPMRFYN